MHTYKIFGMKCNGCKNNVEKVLSNIKEIKHITIDLQTSELTLEMTSHISLEKLQKTLFDANLTYTIEMNNSKHNHKTKIIKPQKDALYYCPMHCEGKKTYTKSGSCPVCGMDLVPLAINESDEQKIYKKLLTKMKISTLFTLPIFIISMSDLIPSNPLMNIMSLQNWNYVQFLLVLPIVFYTCWMFFVRAYNSIITWNLNMFTLIGMGTGVAFLFSVIAMFFPDIFPNEFKTPEGTVHLYFEATAVILTLVLLGQLLEAKAHSQTSDALKKLLKLVPSEAILIQNEQERVVSIDEIKKDDLLRVKPGDKIPVDGEIKQGESSIDESMISGEPIPIDKIKGDKVSAGTINGTKSFVMIAKKVGEDTLLAHIIKMVDDASKSRAPIQKQVDTVSKYFVPIVILASLITFTIWAIFGPEPVLAYAFVNAIAVLIIACPCALGLATPMSIMVGVGKGASSGILIKNAESLEIMNKVDVIITDKTGTITQGRPSVEKVFALDSKTTDDLLQKVASLNHYSEHPLAQAIMQYAKEKNTTLTDVNDFESITGRGVVGTLNDKKVAFGNLKLMQEINAKISSDLNLQISAEQKLGKTVSYISVDGVALGYISIYDVIKPSSKIAIKELLESGIEVIMMSGDNSDTVKAVADELGLNNFIAESLPEDKLNKIKELQAEGKIVAMAGDGINDSPALAQADVGIAMGTGTDVAIESSEITLVKGDLQGILKAKKLSFETIKNIKQNLFFAFFYNALGVPIAAGILFPFFGILLSPMIAAAAMSFSSVSVITNSLRLKKVVL
jgi:Cu2+-exporting ATPase